MGSTRQMVLRALTTTAGMLLLLLAVGTTLASGVAGDLDTGFDSDGVLLVANSNGYIPAIGEQTSGKIVLGSTAPLPSADGGSRSGWHIRRHDSAGILDSTFGTSGEVDLFGDFGTDSLRFLMVDASDRILCVGSARTEVTSGKGKKKKTSYPVRFTVVRLLASGVLDTAFGDDGVVQLELPEANGGAGRAESIVELSGGDLLVAGQAFNVASSSSGGGGGKGKKGGGGGQTSTSDAIALVKLTSAGALDTAFGDDGVAIHDASSGDDEPWPGALGVQSTGRIVIGSVARDIDEQWVLTAYDSDGAVDDVFGRVSVEDAYLRGLAIDSSDRILGSGYAAATPGEPDFVVTRHASDGSVDTTFGTAGSVDLALSESSEGAQLVLQTDGKIVAGLNIINASGVWRCQPVRLTSGGALDTSFGTGGYGEVLEATSDYYGLFVSGFIDASGDIVLGGVYQEASGDASWVIGRWCGS